MNKPLAITIGLIVFLVLILFSTTYSVAFHEAAVQKRFGREMDVIVEPGLRFKLPIFADQVSKYDTRLQLLESPFETVTTADDQQIVVRGYLLWRVDKDNVLEFDKYGSIEAASQIMNDRFKSALLAGLSRYRFSDLLGPESRLEEAEQAVLRELEGRSGRELAGVAATGIEPVAVGISQVMFPQRTSRAVLTRMKETRETLARSERAKGQAEAHRIESEADTMAGRIMAFAHQRAAEIQAAGAQEAAQFFAQMARHPELARFLSELEALEAILSERATFILETGMAPMQYLDLDAPLSAEGIPVPSRTYAERRQRDAARAALANPAKTTNPSGDAERDHPSDEIAERADADEPARAAEGN